MIENDVIEYIKLSDDVRTNKPNAEIRLRIFESMHISDFEQIRNIAQETLKFSFSILDNDLNFSEETLFFSFKEFFEKEKGAKFYVSLSINPSSMELIVQDSDKEIKVKKSLLPPSRKNMGNGIISNERLVYLLHLTTLFQTKKLSIELKYIHNDITDCSVIRGYDASAYHILAYKWFNKEKIRFVNDSNKIKTKLGISKRGIMFMELRNSKTMGYADIDIPPYEQLTEEVFLKTNNSNLEDVVIWTTPDSFYRLQPMDYSHYLNRHQFKWLLEKSLGKLSLKDKIYITVWHYLQNFTEMRQKDVILNPYDVE